MAVTQARELFEERHGQGNYQGDVQYTRTWKVETDSITDDATVVLAYMLASVAAYGDVHPNDNLCGLERFEAVPDAAFDIWKVTAHYTSTALDPTKLGLPTGRSPEWKLEYQKYTKAAENDTNGVPFLNTAGQPFSPPVELESSRTIIVVSKNYETVDATALATLCDGVNNAAWSTPFGTVEQYCGKCTPSVERMFEAGAEFFRITYRVEVKLDAWYPLLILSKGFNEVFEDGLGARLRPICDDQKKPLTEASLLDIDGHRIPPAGAPYFIPFSGYAPVSFAAIP